MFNASGLRRIFLLVMLVLVASGCQRFKFFDREDPAESLPVDQLYTAAKDSLRGGNVGRATKYYERLLARFPYGRYTEQSQLELAYAHYKNNKPAEATAAVERFIKTYPTHPNIDYAYYLRGLINFNRDSQVLAKIVNLDLTQRDQGAPRQSFNDFADVIRRYPNSPYAADARLRMIHLRDQLARYEINIAEYYLRRRAYVAAVERAKFLIATYPQSTYQADALAVMAISYERLGRTELANDARRVLQLNDPNHPFFRGGWPENQAWWKKLNPFTAESRG